LVRKISEQYDSRMSHLLAALLLLCLGSARLAAQGSERWQIRLDQDEYVWDVRLLRLAGESLLVRQADSTVVVPVGRISEVRLLRKTEMQLGDGAAAMSALTGGDDEVYDLSPLDFAERLRAIQKILLYHPPEP
jgi:hypothetical protein